MRLMEFRPSAAIIRSAGWEVPALRWRVTAFEVWGWEVPFVVGVEAFVVS